jgi:chromosome segregation ATPase
MIGVAALDDKVLADTIYQELVKGLKAGDLDWTHFLAKYGSSKGVLYDTIGRFFRDMEPEVRALNEAQAKLGEARLQLKSLGQKIRKAEKLVKEKDQDVANVEEKQDVLQQRLEQLESAVEQKREVLERLQELEKLGFCKERLEDLHTSLLDMGSKRGLKPEEVADAFFTELKRYDSMVGLDQEVQRLEAVAEAKRAEAEQWSVRAEACEAKYKELQEAVSAIQSLSKRGVKPKQIASWNSILSCVGGVEELEKCLDGYGSVQDLVAAKEKEQEQLDTKLAEERAAVKTLTKQRAEVEASIKALRVSAVKEIEKVSQAGVERVSGVAQAGSGSIELVGRTASAELKEARSLIDEVAASSINSIGQVGKAAVAQLQEALSLVDQVCARALEVGGIVDQAGDKLAKSRQITEATATLLTMVEGNR